MAADRHPNLLMRKLQEHIEAAKYNLLAGTPNGIPADQVGIAYATYSGRYHALSQLEAEFTEMLSKGETLDDE